MKAFCDKCWNTLVNRRTYIEAEGNVNKFPTILSFKKHFCSRTFLGAFHYYFPLPFSLPLISVWLNAILCLETTSFRRITSKIHILRKIASIFHSFSCKATSANFPGNYHVVPPLKIVFNVLRFIALRRYIQWQLRSMKMFSVTSMQDLIVGFLYVS